MTQVEAENQLILKIANVGLWGFDKLPATGGTTYRYAPNGWIEVWRSTDPDVIALYKDRNINRTADIVHRIDWTLHGL